MDIRITDGDIHLLDIRTRMPFKYGIATMTSTPHLFLRLQVEVRGKPATGVAADHLPPKWFTKDPIRPVDAEVSEMADVIEHALALAVGLRADSPFAAWRALWDAQHAWGMAAGLPPLLSHFGTSLVERALIDAVCRSLNRPFAELLHANAFGIELGEVRPPALVGQTPAELLPRRPLGRVIARHTVGLADPLEDADVAPEERLQDGLPQSLTDCIRTYGLRHFKIKVSGALDRDLERLARVAAVVRGHAPADYALSLDGNEQFHSFADFRTFWDAVTARTELRSFFAHLLFVEQPFHRDIALRSDALRGLWEWGDRPPIIIDESDGDFDSLDRALSLGYAGTSHKNCKGVFKGIANACHLEQGRRCHFPVALMLSGEDLANIGPVALLQDLTVAACLGISSIERNGHHYFAGLSMFPREVQGAVLAAHGDLYHASAEGWPTLTIKDGALAIESLLAAPFGVKPLVRVEQFTPLEEWRRARA